MSLPQYLVAPNRRIVVRRRPRVVLAPPAFPQAPSEATADAVALEPAVPAPTSAAPRVPGYRLPLPTVSIAGTDFDVDLLAGGRLLGPPAIVKATNLSLYLLQLALGSHGDYLQPGETNVFDTHGAATMHVHPVALSSPTPTATPGTLVAAVATEGATFPGTWPAVHLAASSTTPRPFDWVTYNNPAAGTEARVQVFNPPPTQFAGMWPQLILIGYEIVNISGGTAAAHTPDFQVWDGNGGVGGTPLFVDALGIDAVEGQSDGVVNSTLSYLPRTNGFLTLQFSVAPPAGTEQRIISAGYAVPAGS